MVYVLFPGSVVSETDGQLHHITAPQLARLYGVDYKKCKVVCPNTRGYRKQKDDVELRPSFNGDYSLPDGGDLNE